MDHPIRCRCGTVAGTLVRAEHAKRGVCYCRDCQAFAHALGDPAGILDPLGGSDVVATLQQNISIRAGAEALVCLSLTGRGLLRWYASCCNTPIGSTLRDRRIAYVSLLHNCLEHGAPPLDEVFGPVRMRVNTQSAKGPVSPTRWRTLASAIPVFAAVLRARLDGSYRRTPFFDAATGTPIAPPRVLTAAERERAMSAV